MTEELKLKLRQLKSKNNKVKSNYLHLCDSNIGRKRALATFTVQAMTAKQLQLLLIKEIKNYFSKRLQNLKVDVQYFSVIELGQHKSNPHLHVQLFYDEKDFDKVKKAYKKTIEYFSLVERRCKLTEEDKDMHLKGSFNYVIKEFDNLTLTDKEILDLDRARKRLKQGNTKHLQFFSKSRSQLCRPLYKALWFKHKLKYMHVNTLMDGFAKRLQGLKLLEARQINELPYILFKDGAIQVNSTKLYNLILLALLFMVSIYFKNQIKCIYRNKLIERKSQNKYLLVNFFRVFYKTPILKCIFLFLK